MLLIHIFIFNQKRKFYINKGIRQLLLFAYVFQYNNKLLNKTFLNIHLISYSSICTYLSPEIIIEYFT
jgi:hypothetical protein